MGGIPGIGGGGVGLPAEIVGATVLACLLLTGTVLLLARYRQRRDALVLRERQAREQMQELCPEGWKARIVLYGEGAPMPDDAPEGHRKVCVEWTEFQQTPMGRSRVAVARRMWAKTIPGALRGMLADRQLDVELEKIEQLVFGGGDRGHHAAGPRGDR